MLSNPIDNWTKFDPIAFPGDFRQFHQPPAIFQGRDVPVTDTDVIILLEAKVTQTKTGAILPDGSDEMNDNYTTSIVYLKKELAGDRSDFRNKVGFISDPQSKYFQCFKCSTAFNDTKLKYQCKFCKEVICSTCSLGVLERQYTLEQFERFGFRVCLDCGPAPKLKHHLTDEQDKLDKFAKSLKEFEKQEAAAKAKRIMEDQAKYDATMQYYAQSTFRRPVGK